MNAPRIFAGLAWVALVATAAWAPLTDRDEPRYAQAVREMRQSGDLLVPRNFGQLRPDKPILIYWLQLATTAVVGEKELGFRLPSLLALLVWLCLASSLAQELCGDRRGALLPGMALAGVLATPDALVGALTTASLLAFIRAAKAGLSGLSFLAWLLLGLGVLVKGPVTPLFVMPALAGYCGKDKNLWRMVVPWWGPLVALGVVAAWFVPANLATHWELARMSLGKHVVQRALQPLEGHGVRGPLGVLLGLPFYGASLAVAGFPLVFSLVRFIRAGGRGEQRLWRTVLWGVGGPLLVLSFVATKLPHYILPVAPLTLLAAKPTPRQQALAALASTTLALGLLLVSWQTPYRTMGRMVAGLGQTTCAFSPQEPSLRFYAGEKLVLVQGPEAQCGFFLVRQEELPRLAPYGLPGEQVAQFRGWNLAKGRREVFFLYQLRMGRREKENPGPGGSSAENSTGLGLSFAEKKGFPNTRSAAILAR